MSGIFQGSNLLTAQEVEEVLKIKVKTLMKWVYEQKIPFIRFGPGKRSIIRFSPHHLNNWLENFYHAPDDTQGGKPGSTQKPKRASKKTVEDFNKFVAKT
jgi:excisionase family DNA binding protein